MNGRASHMQRLILVSSAAFVCLSITAKCHSADTAGVMLAASGFNQPNLVSAQWHAVVPEYESTASLRIEFNSINFWGSGGGMRVNAMAMNLCHDYVEDSTSVTSRSPGFSLYFSSFYENINEGMESLADPTVSPRFKRIFENVDGLGYTGCNLYNTQPIREPAANNPVELVWNVSRGNSVVDPQGQFSKNTAGQWVPLVGTYREWFFQVSIDGTTHDVARYLLPETYAEHICGWDPIALHQEFFGASTGDLDDARSEIRFYGFELQDELGNTYPLTEWVSIWRIDNDDPVEWDKKDKRFGWYEDGPYLVSRSGHDSDIALCTRELGHVFETPEPATMSLLGLGALALLKRRRS